MQDCRMKKFPTLFLIALLVGCSKEQPPQLEPSSEAQIDFMEEQIEEQGTIAKVSLPRKAYIEVPFASQAPEGNWDNPYQEACEEASVIMVDYFLRRSDIDTAQANREILQLTNWEEAKGYKYDVNLDELAQIVRDYYGYNARISDDVTVEAIQHEIAKGNPVILPAAGRKLKNPYFSGQGPWYHMLVVTGYNTRYFFTNDPGTKRGEDYKYTHKTLLDAIHDFPGKKEEIETGPKRMLIVTHES